MRDIPQSELQNAVKNGGTPGLRMQSPDGTVRVVPAPQVHQAYQNGGKLLPIEDQETTHPGFWSAVAEDAWPMLKSLRTSIASGAPGMAYQGIKHSVDEVQSLKKTGKTVEENQETGQSAAGYGPVYRKLSSPTAQGVGVNVPGMEASAAQGDVGGVLGHAAVPTAAAAAPLIAEGLVKGGLAVAGNETVGKVAKTGGEVAGAGFDIANVATFDRIQKLYAALKKRAASIDEIWKGKEAASTGEPLTPNQASEGVNWREPEMGSPPSGVAASPEPTGQTAPPAPVSPPANMPPPPGYNPVLPKGTKAAQVIKTLNQAEALRQPVRNIVDAAVPPANQGANMEAHAAVDFFLKKGDVAGAESALDDAAKGVNPNWPPESPTFRGTTNDIRDNPGPQALEMRTPADIQEDRAMQQEMKWDVEKHGFKVESDARKEFIARNSTGVTKGELTGTQPKPVKFTTTPSAAKPPVGTPADADLENLLQQSLAAVQAAKK